MLIISSADIPIATFRAFLMTITAQFASSTLPWALYAINTSFFGPLLLLIGYIMYTYHGNRLIRRNIGRSILGLGVLMVSIKLIGIYIAPIKSNHSIHVLFQILSSDRFIAFFLSAALTWLLFSSLATILIISALATGMGSEIFTLNAIYSCTLGVSFGTIIPVYQYINKSSHVFHLSAYLLVTTRVFVCFIFLVLQPWLVEPITHATDIGDTPSQIMVWHIMISALSFLFVPFVGQLEKLVEKFSPLKKEEDKKIESYLNWSMIDTPDIAIKSASREAVHISEQLNLIVKLLRQSLRTNFRVEVSLSDHINNSISHNQAELKKFIIRLTKQELSTANTDVVSSLLNFSNNLTQINYILNDSLVPLFNEANERKLHFPKRTMNVLTSYLDTFDRSVELTMSLLLEAEGSINANQYAQKVLANKSFFRNQEIQEFQAISGDSKLSKEHQTTFLKVSQNIRRAHVLLCSIAYDIHLDTLEDIEESNNDTDHGENKSSPALELDLLDNQENNNEFDDKDEKELENLKSNSPINIEDVENEKHSTQTIKIDHAENEISNNINHNEDDDGDKGEEDLNNFEEEKSKNNKVNKKIDVPDHENTSDENKKTERNKDKKTKESKKKS